LLRSEFFRNVMTLLTGTALGQLIALLLSPILTRLFSLNDFSTYEQYSFLCSLLMVIITGRYEFAVMQPRDKEGARHVAGLSIRIAFYFSLVLLVILVFTAQWIADFNRNQELYWLLFTLPIAVFCAGVFQTINYWFSRIKNYRVAATSRMLYTAGGEPFKAVAGFVHPSAAGLVWGAVLGHVVSAWYAWRQFLKDEPRTIFNLSKDRLWEMARRYKEYPVYGIWGAILNNLAQWAHVAVFTYFYGERALVPIAFIALSRRIFFNPLGMLAGSYGQVFYQRISEMHDGKELKRFFLKNLFRFLAVAVFAVAAVQLLPDNTLGFIFGEEWREAMVYLRILSYWYALNFAISSLSFIFNRLKLQWYTLVIDAIHFVSVVAAFAIAYHNHLDELGAVRSMVIAKVIYLTLNILAVIYFLNRNIRKPVIHV
jgi:O-antigen/teichoic acid export membrane protein